MLSKLTTFAIQFRNYHRYSHQQIKNIPNQYAITIKAGKDAYDGCCTIVSFYYKFEKSNLFHCKTKEQEPEEKEKEERKDKVKEDLVKDRKSDSARERLARSLSAPAANVPTNEQVHGDTCSVRFRIVYLLTRVPVIEDRAYINTVTQPASYNNNKCNRY